MNKLQVSSAKYLSEVLENLPHNCLFDYELTISNKGNISVKITGCVGDVRGIQTLITTANWYINRVSVKSINELEPLLANAKVFFDRSTAEDLVVQYKLGIINGL